MPPQQSRHDARLRDLYRHCPPNIFAHCAIWMFRREQFVSRYRPRKWCSRMESSHPIIIHPLGFPFLVAVGAVMVAMTTTATWTLSPCTRGVGGQLTHFSTQILRDWLSVSHWDAHCGSGEGVVWNPRTGLTGIAVNNQHRMEYYHVGWTYHHHTGLTYPIVASEEIQLLTTTPNDNERQHRRNECQWDVTATTTTTTNGHSFEYVHIQKSFCTRRRSVQRQWSEKVEVSALVPGRISICCLPQQRWCTAPTVRVHFRSVSASDNDGVLMTVKFIPIAGVLWFDWSKIEDTVHDLSFLGGLCEATLLQWVYTEYVVLARGHRFSCS
jgi:hypothetical protein